MPENRGRPRISVDKFWPIILKRIANGESLSAVMRTSGYPSYEWAKKTLREDPELRRQYEQAYEDRADVLADQLIDLADLEIPEGLDGSAFSAWVQLLRLRVDVRKWTASKLRPRFYGERIDLEVTHHEQISITQVLEDARKRVLTIDV
jgi:hypothetical protein